MYELVLVMDIKFDLNDSFSRLSKNKSGNKCQKLDIEIVNDNSVYPEFKYLKLDTAFICISKRKHLLEDMFKDNVIDKGGLACLTWLSANLYLYYIRNGVVSMAKINVEYENDDVIKNIVLTFWSDLYKKEDAVLKMNYNKNISYKKLIINSRKRIVKKEGIKLENLAGSKILKSISLDDTKNINLHYIYGKGSIHDVGPTFLIEQNGLCMKIEAIIEIPHYLESFFGIRHEELYQKMVELIGEEADNNFQLVTWL